MFEGKVRTKASGFLQWIIAPIVALGMLSALIWFIIKTTEWFFGVPLFFLLLFLSWKSGLFRLYANILNPHNFTITRNGLISKDAIFIPWVQIKEIIFFNHGGYQHLGVKLNESVSSIDGKPLGEVFRKNTDWAFYKMPIVTMTDHLNPSRKELAIIFKDDYKVPVRFLEKEIEINDNSL
jgi:hypothetical protein